MEIPDEDIQRALRGEMERRDLALQYSKECMRENRWEASQEWDIRVLERELNVKLLQWLISRAVSPVSEEADK